MIEAYAAGARALAVLASAHLIGVTLFLLRAGPLPAGEEPRAWDRGLRRTLPIAALLLCLALLAVLHAQACGVAGGWASPDLMAQLARDTAYGHWWCLRALGAMAVLFIACVATATPAPLLRAAALVGTSFAAATTIALAPLTGHAAGTEQAAWLVPLHMAHLLALSAWLGALPAWIGLARRAAHEPDARIRDFVARALERFSRLAMACMAVIVGTGVVLAFQFIDDQGDLLGTRYGLLLCAKLVVLVFVLRIADAVRRRVLPRLRTAEASDAFAAGATSVRLEWWLALGLLGLGATLAQTVPAIHDQPSWWMPVRLSFEAGWADPATRVAIWLGAALIVFAAALIAPMRRSRPLRMAVSVIGVAGVATALWGLSVSAFPDTFLRPPVPYLSLSIDQGRRAFEANCTACHGSGGLGDGALGKTMRKPPANLSEPHTALHTPGDMYWWFTHGMPAGPMPGFAGVLDDEQRWDLVNFLRVFSQGFQARVLGPRVVPGKPWLGAPDFYYQTGDGSSAQFKDLRGRSPALVVFDVAEDPLSVARLEALRNAADASFTLIVPRSEDVWQAYQFLTRTLADRGASDRVGMPRRHVEFLIDRFGYIRARWIPSDEAVPWTASFDVKAEVARLASEPQILPPPDLHLH
ncbi:putative copper resistance protein D [Panacagrimonas perspica]|uniref:Copper resistance protein D n=1 Tax=Panacagrimonas perspica TaxID=381431 RepID=A0A4S3KAA3_9GAMM|nr:CopD family protein [Panacagrimonas perspica]TDU32322.1 putative copper resistance protein D [Panacagrimonas perspica]THD05260.1 hypothetical protein B1810_00465 [Panacagrimonas perspica]